MLYQYNQSTESEDKLTPEDLAELLENALARRANEPNNQDKNLSTINAIIGVLTDQYIKGEIDAPTYNNILSTAVESANTKNLADISSLLGSKIIAEGNKKPKLTLN